MITDSFEIFCDKYHKRQHISDDLIKYIMNTLQIKEEHKEENKQLKTNITIINCENCKYDKCEFYNKSGNSWCPRCKGLNYHTFNRIEDDKEE